MKNGIEALSLLLTAGAGAGALIARYGGIHIHGCAFAGCILAAGCLVTALRTNSSGYAFFPLFFLLGVLASLTSAMPPAPSASLPFQGAGDSLRAAVDGLPFRHSTTGPLLKAFLTGDRSGLPKETVAVFRRSGASHLLALSGLHIGIIYTLFARILSVFGNAKAVRIGRFAITIPAALWFTLMTGASPSIVRAFLFISLSELAALLGRPRHPMKVFAGALTIQLVLTPQVITSVGFQLSYMAMLGILLLFPPMRRWYPAGHGFNPVRKIWEVAALSIACQVTTAPLAWFYFRTFPRYFLITNIMTIPLTTVTISLGIAVLALSAAGLRPHILLTATDAVAVLLLRCLETIAAL